MRGDVGLFNALEKIASDLSEEVFDDLAAEVLRASKFYGSVPSEFMGESWLALKKILVHKNEFSQETALLVENISCQIELGFKRVGQKLPK